MAREERERDRERERASWFPARERRPGLRSRPRVLLLVVVALFVLVLLVGAVFDLLVVVEAAGTLDASCAAAAGTEETILLTGPEDPLLLCFRDNGCVCPCCCSCGG